MHRDLKPGNVTITEEGRVKVLDFGLAKLTEVHPSTDATLTAAPKTEEGTVMGTAAYMSPEQAEGKRVDARSDIFSFGALSMKCSPAIGPSSAIPGPLLWQPSYVKIPKPSEN